MKTKLFLLVALIMVTVSVANAQSKGYEKSIEINGGVGLDNYSKYSFGIAMINGYRFSDHFYLGAGVGYKYINSLYYTSTNYVGDRYTGYYESFDSRNLIQIYARAKANLSKGQISPFFQFDVGGSLDLNSNKDAGTAGGVILEPAFGVDFKTKDPKTAIYVSVGYNMQGISYREWDLDTDVVGTSAGDVMKDGLAGQLTFRVGFRF